MTDWRTMDDKTDWPAPDGEVLVYSKEWKTRTRQVAKLKDGKVFVIGHVFAWDVEPPTHWMLVPKEPN